MSFLKIGAVKAIFYLAAQINFYPRYLSPDFGKIRYKNPNVILLIIFVFCENRRREGHTF
jgi:hypothetical protein